MSDTLKLAWNHQLISRDLIYQPSAKIKTKIEAFATEIHVQNPDRFAAKQQENYVSWQILNIHISASYKQISIKWIQLNPQINLFQQETNIVWIGQYL